MPFRYRLIIAFIFATSLFVTSGCVYYNTFFWARQKFNEAENGQKDDRLRQEQADKSQAQSQPQGPNQPSQPRRQSENQRNPGGMPVTAQQRTLYEDAIRKAGKVLKYHPNSGWADDALWLIGKSYYNMGDYLLADRRFKELVTNHPKSKFADDSYYYMALCQVNLDHDDFALSALESIETADKKSPYIDDALFVKGLTEMYQDDNESAAQVFSDYVKKYPDGDSAALALYYVGQCKYKMKDYIGSYQAYSGVRKYNPGRDLYFDATLAAASAALKTDSVDVGMKILDGLGRDESYYSRLGEVLLRTAEGFYLRGNTEKAVETYLKVTTQSPRTEQSAEAYYRLGLIYQNDKFDMTAAKDAFSKAQSESATSEYKNLSLSKSAQIAKLENYRAQLLKADSLQKAQEQELQMQQMTAPVRIDSAKVSSGAKVDSTGQAQNDTSRAQASLPDSAVKISTTQTDTLARNSEDSLKTQILPDTSGQKIIAIGDSVIAVPDSSAASRIYARIMADSVGTRPDTLKKTLTQNSEPALLSTDSIQIARADSIRKSIVESGIETRYLMSELYSYELNRPDSALNEFHMIATEYPNSPYAPRALLAAAKLEFANNDTAAAKSDLDKIIKNYPSSPQAAEAATTLNSDLVLENNAVGLYAIAESLVYQGNNPDSALALFKYIALEFPDLAPKASFATAWVLDQVIGVEDSSAYFAYDSVLKKYPQTPYADAASERLGLSVKQETRRSSSREQEMAQPEGTDSIADTSKQMASRLPMAPHTKTVGEFLYPEKLLSRDLKGRVLFKIKIDMSGKVDEYDVMGPSGESAIDSAAVLALLKTQFDVSELDLSQLDNYFQYSIDFKRPQINILNDPYRDQQERLGP